MSVSGTPRAWIASPNRGPAAKSGRWIAIHTAEGSTTAVGLGNYFATGTDQSSSHVGIDADGIVQYVPYDQQSWTLRRGNPYSENAELCGFASMTRGEWLSEVDVTREFIPGKGRRTVRRPRQMLRHVSAWIARRCLANNTPIRKLSPAEVGRDVSGVIGHVDYTHGKRDGTHVDPGGAFPWDVVLTDALKFAGTTNKEDNDMTVDEMLSATVTREGLPEGHPLAGQEVSLRTILAWSDANLTALGEAIKAIDKRVTELAARPAAQVKVDATEIVTAVTAVIPSIVDAVADEVSKRMAA